MKKFLSLSVLVVAIASAGFISYGAASRYRPTTDRIYAFSYRNHLRRKVTKPVTEADKFRFWYNFQQQKNVKYDRRAYAAWRSAHNNLFPRDENLTSTTKLVVRNDDARKVRLAMDIRKAKTSRWAYAVDGIKFDVPDSVSRNLDDQYEDRGSDLVFEIDKFEKGCSAASFQMCAVQRVKHLRARRSLKAVTNIKREFSLRRMAVDGRFVYVPQFMESFEVNDFGIDRMYSVYTMENPLTKEVVYMEGWSSVRNSARAKNILKAVARTIRFN